LNTQTQDRLARICHQAASDTDKTLVIKRETEMIKNTERYSKVPVTVQASIRVRKLAPVILVRNAG
jgi:hypothetical protein